MYIELIFETTRFHVFKFDRRFDKTISPGEDVATWLREHLKAGGYFVSPPRLAGRVWVIEVVAGDCAYLLGIRADPIENARQHDQAQWRVVVEKKRGRLQRLTFSNRLDDGDHLCQDLQRLFQRQFDFSNVRRNRYLMAP